MSNEFQPTEGQDRLLREIGLLDPFYALSVEAVEYAAEAINQTVAAHGFQDVLKHSEAKEDGSPVSSADRASHETLTTYLRACSPFPIVSEEEPGGVPNLESIRQAPFFWLADPLDGTRDFLAGEKSYAVSLALMHVSEASGEITPYFGCISDPTARTTWWASRDTQLIKRIEGEEVELPSSQVDRSDDHAEDAVLRVLGSRSIPSDRMRSLYEFWKVQKITRLGSALKFALIAEGSFDVYPRFGPTYEWDTAAGQLLLEIAGGGLVSLETGRSMQYGKPEWLNHGFLAMRSEKLIEEWLPRVRSRLKV
jgi:3'(2'), 5'-bisphosphate nucleotidase